MTDMRWIKEPAENADPLSFAHGITMILLLFPLLR
jgi:hypothetical protein